MRTSPGRRSTDGARHSQGLIARALQAGREGDAQGVIGFQQRELSLKGGLARLSHRRALERFSGSAGIFQQTYRWPNARRIAGDDHEGLSPKAPQRRLKMLGPDDRRLLLDALRPPAGYELDQAVGTSYSLDLTSLLAAPLGLALFDRESSDGQLIADPIAFDRGGPPLMKVNPILQVNC